MRAIVLELFQRFLSKLAPESELPLYADKVQLADDSASLSWPTVLVHGRHGGTDGPLALVLMAAPSHAADDQGLLDFATRRARAYKAPFFVTWTLRDSILWRTPKPGTPATRNAIDKLRDYPDLFEINPSTSSLHEANKIRVLQHGDRILRDLERLLKDEALELVQIDATYFVGRLLEAVHRLLPLVSESLVSRLSTDHVFRNEMAIWAVRQGIAGDPQDVEFAQSVARQIIYRLLGKVLFYHSLRRVARHLPDLDFKGVDSSQVLPKLRAAFSRALEIDYHAVFAEDLPDRVQWPSHASIELAALIEDFHTRDFSHLPQDVIGTVFEQLIPPEERHGFGQYFTPEGLCDLIIGFCVRSPNDCVLDPTCGTGTFLIRAYDRLRCLGQTSHVQLLSQIWGVDIAPFPAELATINLFRQRVAEHGNFPRIVCQDVFSMVPGQQFRFPPPKVDLEHPELIEHEIPMFGSIVGNFPFIRQEMIEKLVPGYKRHIEQVIARDWFAVYPDAFTFRSAQLMREFQRLRRLKEPCVELCAEAELKLSGKADILAYLFFHVGRFLAPGGRMGIITSNAWLDVEYGQEVQQFLLDNFKVVAILESRCEPWFTEADVNTVATIIERCDSEKDREDHLVKFVKVKRSLSDLVPADPRTDAVGRWSSIRKYVERIEHTGWKDRKTRPIELIFEEDDDFRIRVRRQGDLSVEAAKSHRTKWGVFVRAPRVYFDIVNKWRRDYGDAMITLDQLVDIQSGIPTRINEFFYLSANDAELKGIEACYLSPVIKSTRSSDRIKVSPAEIDTRVFLCNADKNALKKKRHTGALKHIEWGETQATPEGIPWPDGPSVRNRQPGWWALGECQLTQICWTRFVGEKCFHLFSDVPVFADNALYVVQLRTKVDPRLVAALLNSSLFALFQEVYGRTALGGGLLQIFLDDVRPIPLPNPETISSRLVAKIVKLFDVVATRPIESVFAEIQRPDRQALDKAILEAVGLDPRKYLRPIYEGLCELVRERISLGQMRGKARKVKARGTRAEKQVAEGVLEELLPDGPKRFPEDFWSTSTAKSKKVSIQLPDDPLIFDHSPLFMGVHTANNSFSRNVKAPAEGKFLLYAQLCGHRTAELPDQIVEVNRTVANYEKYLRELRKELYEAYYRRTLDTRTAARLTQAAFSRFRLPSVEG